MTRSGLLHASAKPRAAIGASRTEQKVAGGGAVVVALFHIIIELPSVLKSKLLPNLYGLNQV